MKPVSSVSSIYDNFSNQYRSYAEQRSQYCDSIDQYIIERLSASSDVLLDYGCGDGVRGSKIAKSLGSTRFYQADVSTKMLKLAASLGTADAYIDVKNESLEDSVLPIDSCVCLWNVLGHLSDTNERIQLLSTLYKSLKSGGQLIFDVNNRHNKAYGKFRSLFRILVDSLFPDESRGDIYYDLEN